VTSKVASSLIMFAAFSLTISAILLLYVSRSHLDMDHMGRSSHFYIYYSLASSSSNRRNDPYDPYAPSDADMTASEDKILGHLDKLP
jgi:hypothetical protein